jgi:hypothetical protein
VDLKQEAVLDPQLDQLKKPTAAVCRKAAPAFAFCDRFDRLFIER